MDICNEAIYIKAEPPVVWEAVKAQRAAYKTTVIEISDQVYYLTQEFPTPLGPAPVRFFIHEYPYQRMDFKLNRSPVVNVIEGHWSFEKTPVGTQLRLVIYNIKPKIIVPRVLLKALLVATVKERLKDIKKLSEESQAVVSHMVK